MGEVIIVVAVVADDDDDELAIVPFVFDDVTESDEAANMRAPLFNS